MARNLRRVLLIVAVVSWCLVSTLEASEGDADPLYKSCVDQCQKTGCVGDNCFQHCKFSADGKAIDGPWYMQEPLYLRWKQWDCQSDCQYECMMTREEERKRNGEKPTKYFGKWPLKHVYGIQEPLSVAFSALDLAIQFHGWVSYFILVYYNLPLQPNRKTYYEYNGLLHIYAIIVMNSLFWSGVCHSRDVALTERLDYSSATVLAGFSLILAIIRSFSIHDKSAKVLVTVPILAVVATHILYLNFYNLDEGLHRKVIFGIGAVELVVWGVWAALTSHPSKWKLRAFFVSSILTMCLRMLDFPPYKGYVDAHALWRAAGIPLSYLWWSFACDDAVFRTTVLLKKSK
ncbi:post-GPI attachment to proteins factor 3 isoform X1 [Brassica rapa]|uniref:Post-GPI attachment to proteins factor 3 n=2 Tax=Brassica campestris TaxID=3711 RepID=M4D0R1_BRACM|nr:post-GPI attachment to proteins factor 3 isoform X1 [Brassica rapa]